MTESEVVWKDVEPVGPMLRPAQAAAFLGICKRAYYSAAQSGDLPKPVRLLQGGHATGVPKSWLDAVVAARVGEAA